jgi:plastocyanin
MHLHRMISSLAVVGAAAALLAGCGGASGTAKAPAPSGGGSSSATPGNSAGAIKIDNFAFSPNTLTVSGGRVTVSNADSTTHTVTADDGHGFDTGPVSPGSSSPLTVTKPGRYAYHCSIHPDMHGTLVVTG